MKAFWTIIPLARARRAGDDHLSAHRTVMGLFPPLGERPRSKAGVLFRIEPAFGRLLIQSSAAPSPEQVERLGGQTRTVDLSEVTRRDQLLRYRIDVAAVRRRGRCERRLRTEEIPAWWAELAARSGLHLDGLSVGHFQGVTDKSAEGPQPNLRIATFDGIASVSDPEKLLRSLSSGIGRARAYGCGLLTAIPVR